MATTNAPTAAPEPPAADGPEDKRALRKADVWTGGILAIVAVFMIAKATTFPLEGNYAGVKNAWYVSPALFPLIVGGILLILSIALILKGRADYRRLAGTDLFAVPWGETWRSGQDVVIVSALLAGYIVGLIPRVDFVAATAFFLVVFMLIYIVTVPSARRLLLGGFLALSGGAFLVALVAWPAPRSGGQNTVDLLIWAAAGIAAIVGIMGSAAPARRRAVQAVITSLVTAIILAAAFKYFLLVPLPTEGWTVGLMDGLRAVLLAKGR
ncbi:hypothetical protein L1787_25405 [Acuticoccus sp. M5D2P5]|uniref:tripartite tricarboxylate transporter TctB family protein n=1 Tax=Acuticoccus kalidii TaxID=2910977 RepID=UPI001F18BE35|nr:tripartite tricarboxylate transporter TctB family protein [Acuticoccus kalidii]MCF3936734.1 hypothetical protein [Acuticoccus kalidii]